LRAEVNHRRQGPDFNRRPAQHACIEGVEHAISSNEVPSRRAAEAIVIAGGGYIANEFAGIFHQFGSHDVVNRSVILRGCDEMRDRLLQISMTKGIGIASIPASPVGKQNRRTVVDGRVRRYRGRPVLFAVGRSQCEDWAEEVGVS
jgi:pyruvate/2-oxoglutarate dehydrogenase complex dihydrolipoamide dehydrogenase (E3) component